MKVIGIDLGGTKIAAGLVSKNGKILREERAPTHLAQGWPGLRKQILGICESLHEPGVTAVGIASAGPLHAPSGQLLDPTNFGWRGAPSIALTRDLSRALKLPVVLENDAAAAALAERWKGKAGADCVVLTLGTGLGMGAICGGQLVRGGRGLHPEGGHLLLRPGDPTAPCGCGNFGCAEAFLSGRNFERRAAKKLKKKGLRGLEIAALAAEGDPAARELFAEYSLLLAEYLQNIVVLYYPKKVIFSGSFAKAHPLFLPSTKSHLRGLLLRRLRTLPLLPSLNFSVLGNHAGILGGAYVALHP